MTNPSAHPLAAFLFIVHALHFLDDGQVTKHYSVPRLPSLWTAEFLTRPYLPGYLRVLHGPD